MSLAIKFSKMHGLGNDFIVLDAVTQNIKIDNKLVQAIANRRLGIGCDQVLVLEPPTEPSHDFYYRIYNANGEEVEQCGNGARCIARFIYENGLSDKRYVSVGTVKGVLGLSLEDDKQVTVTLPPPIFEPKLIPINAQVNTQSHKYTLNINQFVYDVFALSMGNPHCIMMVPNIDTAQVEKIGNHIQKSEYFPNNVNVNFVQVLARNHIKVRTYERGVGETPACGSGACASVVAGILNQELGQQVKVDMPGGNLIVSWENNNGQVKLTGAAHYIFAGTFFLSSE